MKELERYWSDTFNCWYIVGETDGTYYYFWTERDTEENEIPDEALEEPQCFIGAMIGAKEEIIWELENCVGSFRYHGDEEQAEEAQNIVDMMTEALG